ncbi:MAG: SGNH/GDSL hydrolase family protein [Candidatus Aminicenantes bacterium]|nr:SGNH/GDSL hydrolase family protein [Candidatus Aminicenantes bacterium]
MRFAKSWLVLLAIIHLSLCSSVPRGLIILCAGDSITAGDYPRFLQRILKKEGIRAKVLNYGRNGNTSGEYLRYLEENATALSDEYPHFVLLQLGTNDVREDGDKTPSVLFEAHMRKIIRIFSHFQTRSGTNTQILLAAVPSIPKECPYPFSPDSQQRVTAEINPLIRKIAEETGLTFVDNYTLFRNAPHLLPGIHPSKEGYKELARNWYKTLKPLIKDIKN